MKTIAMGDHNLGPDNRIISDSEAMSVFLKHKEAVVAEAARRADLRIRAVINNEPLPEFESMPGLDELAYFA